MEFVSTEKFLEKAKEIGKQARRNERTCDPYNCKEFMMHVEEYGPKLLNPYSCIVCATSMFGLGWREENWNIERASWSTQTCCAK